MITTATIIAVTVVVALLAIENISTVLAQPEEIESLSPDAQEQFISNDNGNYTFSCPYNQTRTITIPTTIELNNTIFYENQDTQCYSQEDRDRINQTTTELQKVADEQVKLLANALAQGGEDEFDKTLTDQLGFEAPEGIRNAMLNAAQKYNTENGITP